MAVSDDGLERFYTLEDVAKASGYSPRRVRDFARADPGDPAHLPTVRLGREYRVRAADYDVWMARMMQAPIPERQQPGTEPVEAAEGRRRAGRRKVMQLVDRSSGEMVCKVCGARHWANLDTGGKYRRGSWQCQHGCSLDDADEASP